MVYSREGEMGHLGSSAIHPCHPCPCYLALGPACVLSRVCPSLLPPQQIINLNLDFLLFFFQKLLSSLHLGFPWKPGWQRWASPALLRL